MSEQWFTVFGTVDNDDSTLIVAAVVEGRVSAVDEESNNEYGSRFASSYYADSPTEAEELAVKQVRAGW